MVFIKYNFRKIWWTDLEKSRKCWFWARKCPVSFIFGIARIWLENPKVSPNEPTYRKVQWCWFRAKQLIWKMCYRRTDGQTLHFAITVNYYHTDFHFTLQDKRSKSQDIYVSWCQNLSRDIFSKKTTNVKIG